MTNVNCWQETQKWTSHELLQPAIEMSFSCQDSWPFFPGPMRAHSIRPNTKEIVLFGDFVDELVKFRDWPIEEFRIWVLSKAVKNVCVELLGLKPEEVGVIPRENLFPAGNFVGWPLKNSLMTAVYSGRFVSNKNYDIFLRVCSALQTEFGWKDLEVVALGNYPDNTSDVSVNLDYLILRLPWTRSPKIITNLGPNEWISSVEGPKVLMNFSLHRREDFGVSVAQARMNGWPCILSDWGGHRDVAGPGVLRIPTSLIPRNVPLNAKISVAPICQAIVDQWGMDSKIPLIDNTIPELLTKNRLEKKENALWKKIATSSLEDLRRKNEEEKFFERYHAIFGGRE